MKKEEYLKPAVTVLQAYAHRRPLCGSESDLTPLQERDDLEGFDWSYNG